MAEGEEEFGAYGGRRKVDLHRSLRLFFFWQENKNGQMVVGGRNDDII